MFVWTVDGVITVVMLSLCGLILLGLGIGLACQKIAEAWRSWRGRK